MVTDGRQRHVTHPVRKSPHFSQFPELVGEEEASLPNFEWIPRPLDVPFHFATQNDRRSVESRVPRWIGVNTNDSFDTNQTRASFLDELSLRTRQHLLPPLQCAAHEGPLARIRATNEKPAPGTIVSRRRDPHDRTLEEMPCRFLAYGEGVLEERWFPHIATHHSAVRSARAETKPPSSGRSRPPAPPLRGGRVGVCASMKAGTDLQRKVAPPLRGRSGGGLRIDESRHRPQRKICVNFAPR